MTAGHSCCLLTRCCSVALPGYAPLPRPSIVGPIGGALLPTEQGFAAPKAAGGWQHDRQNDLDLGTLLWLLLLLPHPLCILYVRTGLKVYYTSCDNCCSKE
jgi:hypothetical protein